MKLRIHNDEIRYRLESEEVQELAETGRVEARLTFGPKERFVYAVETHADDEIAVVRSAGEMTVLVPAADAEQWAYSDQVGFEAQADNGEGGLVILVEKDLPCGHNETEA